MTGLACGYHEPEDKSTYEDKRSPAVWRHMQGPGNREKSRAPPFPVGIYSGLWPPLQGDSPRGEGPSTARSPGRSAVCVPGTHAPQAPATHLSVVLLCSPLRFTVGAELL